MGDDEIGELVWLATETASLPCGLEPPDLVSLPAHPQRNFFQ